MCIYIYMYGQRTAGLWGWFHCKVPAASIKVLGSYKLSQLLIFGLILDMTLKNQACNNSISKLSAHLYMSTRFQLLPNFVFKLSCAGCYSSLAQSSGYGCTEPGPCFLLAHLCLPQLTQLQREAVIQPVCI